MKKKLQVQLQQVANSTLTSCKFNFNKVQIQIEAGDFGYGALQMAWKTFALGK
jgi:hypothetical protein